MQNATTTGMLSDGTMVSIWASTPTANEMMEISIEFEGAEHVNHDIMVTQKVEKFYMMTKVHIIMMVKVYIQQHHLVLLIQ